jgi:hypothetical protein
MNVEGAREKRMSGMESRVQGLCGQPLHYITFLLQGIDVKCWKVWIHMDGRATLMQQGVRVQVQVKVQVQSR